LVLLISVPNYTMYNVRTFQIAILISLILFHCLGRSHWVWLFRGHNLGFLTLSFFMVTGPDLRIYNLWGRVVHYTPRYQVPILIAFYDLRGL
jgi:hypothetical protein